MSHELEVYSIDGLVPVVHPSAYVHPSAVLIGDVIIEADCYIGPCACLRGDFGRLVIKRGANVQDSCVMHGFPQTDTVIEEYGHIGHGAILHGCTVGYNAMVGMNAVVMDEAVIGECAIVAASAFVKAGATIPPRVLVAGIPARVVRELTEDEIKWKTEGTELYQALAQRNFKTAHRVSPLRAIEPNRPRIHIPDSVPLVQKNNRPTSGLLSDI